VLVIGRDINDDVVNALGSVSMAWRSAVTAAQARRFNKRSVSGGAAARQQAMAAAMA